MSGIIGQGVTVEGLFSQWSPTFNISGITATAVAAAAAVGLAVTQDKTVANTMKLAGDGDPIYGYLMSCEYRQIEGLTVGAVNFQFGAALPYTGTQPAIGAQVCGGTTAGSVRTVTAADATGYTHKPCVVYEQRTDGTVVVMMA